MTNEAQRRKYYRKVQRFRETYDRIFNLPETFSYKEDYLLLKQELLMEKLRSVASRALVGDLTDEEITMQRVWQKELKSVDEELASLQAAREDVVDVIKTTVASTRELQRLLSSAEYIPTVDTLAKENAQTEEKTKEQLIADLEL